MPEKWIEVRTLVGQPYTAHNKTITPYSQALVIRLPRMIWGLIWNRPLSVRVESADVPSQTIPVWDFTRLGQIALLGLGLLGSILIGRFKND